MTQDEVLAQIVSIVNPFEPITLDTVVLDHDDLDSLALFNIVITFKQKGVTLNMRELTACTTVKDMVELISHKSAS